MQIKYNRHPHIPAAMELGQGDAEVRAFDQLRTATHAAMRLEYAQRMATNPTPTQQELSLGMYKENLEPQVRAATFTMRDKGYATRASGFFHGDGGTWRILGIEGEDVPMGFYEPYDDPINKRAQVMDFRHGFELDRATIDSLACIGASVIRHPADDFIHRIGFVPETSDIDNITAQWDNVASLLPGLSTPAHAADVFNTGFADWGATAP